jgi:hypothetical protein
MKQNIIKFGALHALLMAGYIVLIASFLFHLQDIFGQTAEGTVLVPIAMLSLLVFSVALTGSLIFGRPVLCYLDGKKKEAIYLLAYTLGFLFLFAAIVFFVLYFSTISYKI